MGRRSLFIIKPDGFADRKQIKTEIEERFRIIGTEEFRFSRGLLSEFYRVDIGKEHFPALVEYMLEDLCEAGLISGTSAIETFLKLAGKSSDPSECLPHTIRSRYGKGLDRTGSGLYIIKNAIHRPITEKEFLEELYLLNSAGVLRG